MRFSTQHEQTVRGTADEASEANIPVNFGGKFPTSTHVLAEVDVS
jgi:hypothetical protein